MYHLLPIAVIGWGGDGDREGVRGGERERERERERQRERERERERERWKREERNNLAMDCPSVSLPSLLFVLIVPVHSGSLTQLCLTGRVGT